MDIEMSKEAMFNVDQVEIVVKAVGEYRRRYEAAENSLAGATDLLFKLWQETKDPRIALFLKVECGGYYHEGKLYFVDGDVSDEPGS